jgi:hypothetical protein
MTTDTLEQVIADAREEAQILRSHGHATQAHSIEALCEKVAGSMRSFLTIMSENEAKLRSGWTTERLRSRFAEWESRGLAMLDAKGRRVYREITVPARTQDDAARLRGERGESIRAS